MKGSMLSFRDRRFQAARMLCVALACLAATAKAEAATPSISGESVTLLTAENPQQAGALLAGIRMEMKDGWHTYWRMPGDSGIPPTFDWSGSENVAAVELLWPAPERFDAKGDDTIGYTREIVWPVLVRAADPARPVSLKLAMSYGVCSNICVPGEANLALDLPGKSAPETDRLIRRYLARVPASPADAKSVSAKFTAGAKPLLEVRLSNPHEVPALIVEGPSGVWFGRPTATRKGEVVAYSVPVELNPGKTLKGAEVTLTFAGPATAIEAKRKLD